MHGPGLLISRSNGGLAIGTCARKDDRVRRDRFRETRARNCAKSCEVDRSMTVQGTVLYNVGGKTVVALKSEIYGF